MRKGQENFSTHNFEKMWGQTFLTFGNNLREKKLKSVEKICMYAKCQENFGTDNFEKIWNQIFPKFWELLEGIRIRKF